jgi:SHS family lactate transporter-like MFS transporter
VLFGSVTLTLLVRLLGGFAAGWAADRWGRKLPFLLAMLWFALFDGLIAIAPSLTWVIVLRTLFGFGMGAEWAAGTTLAMENWPARSRRIASGVLQGSWAIGFCLAALAFWLVEPVWGWRGLFVIAAIPALLVLPFRYWVPESKEWTENKAAGHTASLKDLLHPTLLKNIVWTSLTLGFGFCVYYSLTLFFPTMAMLDLGQTPKQVFVLNLLFNVGFFVGCIVTGIAAKRYGLVKAVAIPALLGIPVVYLYVGKVPDLLWLGALLTGAIAIGWSGVTPALLTGMYPSRVRALCTGVTYHAGAFCSALVPTVGVALIKAGLSRPDMILVMTAVCEVGLVIFLVARRPETIAAQNHATEKAEPGEAALPTAVVHKAS